jgi:hypothetical protein
MSRQEAGTAPLKLNPTSQNGRQASKWLPYPSALTVQDPSLFIQVLHQIIQKARGAVIERYFSRLPNVQRLPVADRNVLLKLSKPLMNVNNESDPHVDEHRNLRSRLFAGFDRESFTSGIPLKTASPRPSSCSKWQ